MKRFFKPKKIREKLVYALYEFDTGARMAMTHNGAKYYVFHESDLRWCNMLGFDIGISIHAVIIGD